MSMNKIKMIELNDKRLTGMLPPRMYLPEQSHCLAYADEGIVKGILIFSDVRKNAYVMEWYRIAADYVNTEVGRTLIDCMVDTAEKAGARLETYYDNWYPEYNKYLIEKGFDLSLEYIPEYTVDAGELFAAVKEKLANVKIEAGYTIKTLQETGRGELIDFLEKSEENDWPVNLELLMAVDSDISIVAVKNGKISAIMLCLREGNAVSIKMLWAETTAPHLLLSIFKKAAHLVEHLPVPPEKITMISVDESTGRLLKYFIPNPEHDSLEVVSGYR